MSSLSSPILIVLTPYSAILVTPEPPDARTDPLDEFILVDEASNLSQTTAEGHRPVDVSSAVFRCFYDLSAMLTPPPSDFLSPQTFETR